MATLHLHTGDLLSRFAGEHLEADYAAVTPTAARPHPERESSSQHQHQHQQHYGLFDSFGPPQFLYQQAAGARLQHSESQQPLLRPPSLPALAASNNSGDHEHPPLAPAVQYRLEQRDNDGMSRLRIEANYISPEQKHRQTEIMMMPYERVNIPSATSAPTTTATSTTPGSGGGSGGSLLSASVEAELAFSSASSTSGSSESALGSGGPHTPPSSRASPDPSFLASVPGHTIYSARQHHHQPQLYQHQQMHQQMHSSAGTYQQPLQTQQVSYLQPQPPQSHHHHHHQVYLQPFQFAGYTADPSVAVGSQPYGNIPQQQQQQQINCNNDYGALGPYDGLMSNTVSFDAANNGQAPYAVYDPSYYSGMQQYAVFSSGLNGMAPSDNQAVTYVTSQEQQAKSSPSLAYSTVSGSHKQQQQQPHGQKITDVDAALINSNIFPIASMATGKPLSQPTYVPAEQQHVVVTSRDLHPHPTGHTAGSAPQGTTFIHHQHSSSVDSLKDSPEPCLSGSDDSGNTTKSTISHLSATSAGSKASNKRNAAHLSVAGTPYGVTGSQKDGEKKFVCSYPGCNKSFSRNFNLSTHFNTHLGVKPFPCTHCSKSFSRRHDCARHIAAVHSNESGKKHRKKEKESSVDGEVDDEEAETLQNDSTAQISPNSCGCGHTCAYHRPSLVGPTAIAPRGPSAFAFIKGYDEDHFSNSSGYESAASSSGVASHASSVEPEFGAFYRQNQLHRSPSFASSTVSLDIGAVKIEDQDGD